MVVCVINKGGNMFGIYQRCFNLVSSSTYIYKMVIFLNVKNF